MLSWIKVLGDSPSLNPCPILRSTNKDNYSHYSVLTWITLSDLVTGHDKNHLWIRQDLWNLLVNKTILIFLRAENQWNTRSDRDSIFTLSTVREVRRFWNNEDLSLRRRRRKPAPDHWLLSPWHLTSKTLTLHSWLLCWKGQTHCSSKSSVQREMAACGI